MKPTSLLISLFLIASLHAQTYQIIKGEEYACPKRSFHLRPLESDDEGFYLIKNANAFTADKDVLHKLDLKTANTVYYKTFGYDIGALKWNITIIDVINNGRGKFLMVLKCVNDAETKMQMVIRQFSAITGEEMGEPKVVDEFETKNRGDFVAKLNTYKIAVSNDKSKLLVVTEYKQDERKQQVKLKILDGKNLELMGLKNVATVFENSTIFSQDYAIDNKGDVAYTFKYIYDPKLEYSRFDKGITWGVGFIPENTSDNALFSLIKRESCIPAKPVLANCNGNIVCTGNYFDLAGDDYRLGFYFCTLDLVKQKLGSISRELLSQDYVNKLTYSDPKGESAVAKRYDFYNVVKGDNCFYTVRFHYDRGKYGDKDYTKEILVHRYDSDGKLEWAKLIPHYGEGTFGNIGMLTARKLHLFYYDNPENNVKYPEIESYEPTKYKMVSSFKKANLICLTFDYDGKLKRDVINTEGQEISLFYSDADRYALNKQNCLITETQIEKEKARYNLIKVTE